MRKVTGSSETRKLIIIWHDMNKQEHIAVIARHMADCPILTGKWKQIWCKKVAWPRDIIYDCVQDLAI